MRHVLLALAAAVVLQTSAEARPWRAHDRLSRPDARLFLKVGVNSVAFGNVVTLLSRLEDGGMPCSTFSSGLHEVTITCIRVRGAGAYTVKYLGGYAGIANLVIEAIWIDGRPLREAERIASINSVLRTGEP